MQKMQVLFPEPLMNRMRRVAKRLDIPVSEVVRRAAENWLDHFPEKEPARTSVPTVNAGRCLASAEEMRDLIYE